MFPLSQKIPVKTKQRDSFLPPFSFFLSSFIGEGGHRVEVNKPGYLLLHNSERRLQILLLVKPNQEILLPQASELFRALIQLTSLSLTIWKV